jgi:imidazolonepropionase-like amidohydrolase
VGKRGDLVLVSANPLEDIANVRGIRAVILGGRIVSRERLDALLSAAEATAARPLSQP